MTSFLSLTGLLITFGCLLMLVATAKAVQNRMDPRRLILWGTLHDAGILIMAIFSQTACGATGAWLFVMYQVASRLLAWFGLQALTPMSEKKDFSQLRGCGRIKPYSGALYAFGMLAAVGGSPFLLPEARAFIVDGVLDSTGTFGFGPILLMAAATTVFIWLHVDAIRQVWLEPNTKSETAVVPFNQDISIAAVIFAVIVALFGIFRVSLTESIAPMGLVSEAACTHSAYCIYYIGAFVTGIAYLFRFSYAAYLGVLTSVLALLAVLIWPAQALAQLFLVMVTVIALVVSLYSLSYIRERKGWYWFFLLLTFASLAGIVSASEASAMYGYWELMTFASYFLVVHELKPTAFEAGLKYYVMCAGGALFMLPGLHILGQFSGDMVNLAQSPGIFKFAAFLCLVGFGVKAGLVPLHSWLPDAHPAAPSSVSGPLSGIITKMGFFGLISVVMLGAGTASAKFGGLLGMSWFGTGLCAMGVATLIYGEIMALLQQDIKRMLAYSTLGQVGEIALVLGLGTWLATTGALWHMLNHAIMKDLLFLGAGALILRAGSRKLADLRGIGQNMPWTAGFMAVGLVSIMGLPPFGAFYSKLLMIQAAIDSGHMGLAVLIFVGSLVGAIYYTRILKTIVFEKRPADMPHVAEAPFTMRIAMGVLAVLSLLMALVPQAPMYLVSNVANMCFGAVPVDKTIMDCISVPWPIYVIVPVFGALLPAFFANNRVKAGQASVGVLLLTALLVLIFGRDLDMLSYCFALLVPIIGAVNMAYAIGYMEHSHTQWRFFAAFTCMCGGLVGMAASQYLLSFFLFWEIMSSWCLYMALAHEGDNLSMREAFKYFMFNMAGAGFLFVAVCVIGPFTPFNLSVLTQGALPNVSHGAFVGMALLAIGFVMKAAQLPFRIDWQMHPAVAPTPVSGFISSVLLKSALFGLIKLFMLLGGGFVLAGMLNTTERDVLNIIVMWIGAITIIMAAVKAMMTNGLKLMFIYSTVSQLGYMVLAVGAGTALGYAGGMLHIVNHIFFKDLLFLICGAVMFTTHRETLEQLGGIGRKMPFTLAMFAIAGLSVVGVPPTSGFSSKWLIYHALMQAGQPFLALLSLFGSVLTLAYIAKFMHAAFLGQPATDLDDVHEAPRVMRIPMGILGLGCIITGIFPGLALAPINTILGEYGAQTLDIGLSGVLSGPGTWNATGMFIMMAIAFFAGRYFVKRFTHLREIDVYTCGVPVSQATSRMDPSSVFGALKNLGLSLVSREVR
ncbi:MAG: oxidoreductase [Desulfovibrionaceae bacterium]|nr:oxidoreductase [Desulfovibrionaceae bacterium]